MPGSTGWRVHLPTAVETRVRAVGRHDPGAPWPSARALSAALAAGAARSGPPRTVGGGRGLPLITGQPLRWAGVDLELECVADRGGVFECDLVAPPWDELVTASAGEEEWWDLVDAVLAAVDARHGAVVDGEALDPADPSAAMLGVRLRRHLGVLVGEHLVAAAGTGAVAYRSLPRSGLVLLLR